MRMLMDDVMCAQVRACGMSGDAHHAVQPDPGGYGAIAAMQQALEIGSVPADKVVYVNAHAASTPQGDALEQLAISKVGVKQAIARRVLLVLWPWQQLCLPEVHSY